MTQQGEGSIVQAAEPEKEDPVEKKPLNIRLILCNDGTLNNRKNIEEREKNSKIYNDFKTDDANSYDNGRTNIAIMEPYLITEKNDYGGDYDFVFKHYIPGQGALTHEKDSTPGYALGVGVSGVAARAEEGIKEAMALIMAQIDPTKYYIAKLTVDVFGFSRGAAAARYAIHVILHGKISNIDSETKKVSYEWSPLAQRLIDAHYEVKENAVEICFAGLYDTVLSVLGSQKPLLRWLNKAYQQNAVSHAKKVLHLAAADEHREDFPLHTIKSAKKNGGEEYFLPGVHSDIGGSYNMASETALNKEADENKKVYMLASNEGSKEGSDHEPKRNWRGKVKDDSMEINEGDPAAMKNDRAELIKQGWYAENETTCHDDKWDEYGNATHSYLTASRQNISSAYCNIPLKIMAEYARKPEVKLKIDDKLEDRANKILGADTNLSAFEQKIKSYIANNKDSKPEDWIGDEALIKYPELKAIRHAHFHFSASKTSVGYAPNFELDKSSGKNRRRRAYVDA